MNGIVIRPSMPIKCSALFATVVLNCYIHKIVLKPIFIKWYLYLLSGKTGFVIIPN